MIDFSAFLNASVYQQEKDFISQLVQSFTGSIAPDRSRIAFLAFNDRAVCNSSFTVGANAQQILANLQSCQPQYGLANPYMFASLE